MTYEDYNNQRKAIVEERNRLLEERQALDDQWRQQLMPVKEWKTYLIEAKRNLYTYPPIREGFTIGKGEQVTIYVNHVWLTPSRQRAKVWFTYNGDRFQVDDREIKILKEWTTKNSET